MIVESPPLTRDKQTVEKNRRIADIHGSTQIRESIAMGGFSSKQDKFCSCQQSYQSGSQHVPFEKVSDDGTRLERFPYGRTWSGVLPEVERMSYAMAVTGECDICDDVSDNVPSLMTDPDGYEPRSVCLDCIKNMTKEHQKEVENFALKNVGKVLYPRSERERLQRFKEAKAEEDERVQRERLERDRRRRSMMTQAERDHEDATSPLHYALHHGCPWND